MRHLFVVGDMKQQRDRGPETVDWPEPPSEFLQELAHEIREYRRPTAESGGSFRLAFALVAVVALLLPLAAFADQAGDNLARREESVEVALVQADDDEGGDSDSASGVAGAYDTDTDDGTDDGAGYDDDTDTESESGAGAAGGGDSESDDGGGAAGAGGGGDDSESDDGGGVAGAGGGGGGDDSESDDGGAGAAGAADVTTPVATPTTPTPPAGGGDDDSDDGGGQGGGGGGDDSDSGD